MQAWQINQQLEQKQLDSWERLHEAYRVKDPNSEVWDVADEACVAAFEHTCPLLGEQQQTSTDVVAPDLAEYLLTKTLRVFPF